jgi:hypothetical protein
VSKAISVVVVGRSLSPQERTLLAHLEQCAAGDCRRSCPMRHRCWKSSTRLRPQAALVLLSGDLNPFLPAGRADSAGSSGDGGRLFE